MATARYVFVTYPGAASSPLSAPTLVGPDEAVSTSSTWTRYYRAEPDGIEVTDVLTGSPAPGVDNGPIVDGPLGFSEVVQLPASDWSMSLQPDNEVLILDGAGNQQGFIKPATATDAFGRDIPVTVQLARNDGTTGAFASEPGISWLYTYSLQTVDVTTAAYPLTIDPYYYRGGRITNNGYTWIQNKSVVSHYHGTNCAGGMCESEVTDGSISVDITQRTMGISSYNTQWDVVVQQVGARPAGYVNGFYLSTFSLRCKVNIAGSTDPYCNGRSSADPDFTFSNSDLRTRYEFTPYMKVPNATTDKDHHYFFEIHIVPHFQEDPYTDPGNRGKFRSYDISCDSKRGLSPFECYFDEKRPTGTGH
jgi:hypothetical protein